MYLNELIGNKVFEERQEKERETIADAIINSPKFLNP